MRRSILLAASLIAAVALAGCGNSGVPAPTATPTPTSAPTPATVAVPDVRGDTEQEALVTFGAAGLTAGTKTNRYDAQAAKGTVLTTDPKAGVVVQRGTAVDYVVSRGPAPTPSPSPKPTPKPTARPTAKPTAAPTAKPTPTPTVKPTPAPVALPGTSWTLKSFVDQDSTTIPVADGVTITASFSATDISGSSGCNTYSGPYTLGSGGAISFGTLVVTGKACSDAVMAEESAYLEALQKTGSFNATTAKLKLVSAGSSARLVYSPGTP